MVHSISKYTLDPVPEFMRTDKFKTYIDSMIPMLINTGTSTQLVVDPSQGSIDAFDLTGYLLDNNIQLRYHYIVMRMNDMTSVHELDENTGVLLLPNMAVLEELIRVYSSSLF